MAGAYNPAVFAAFPSPKRVNLGLVFLFCCHSLHRSQIPGDLRAMQARPLTFILVR